ncbi:MAG: sigma 54-interacting transcriptional regulator [Desulfobacteraceae bacterium]|nr:MAG: sigma 54-interacting transcriptional regulator [Desulfobacteraceae bacterium]
MKKDKINNTGADGSIELRELISFSSYLLDQLNEGILIADHDCIVRYVNPRYTKITGVEFNEIVGRPLLELRPNALLPEVIKENRAVEGVYRKEGPVEYVVNICPLEVNSQIVGGVSIVMDITTVRRMARDLDRSVSKLKKIESSIRSIFPSRYTFKDITGKSPKIRSSIEIAIRAAQSNSNILIRGESGTGKEMFANAIHQESERHRKPFIPVNCAAISPSLLESELFGYSEGAFTGAKKGGKIGLLELGNRGTVFLDEIGDMNAAQQAKILRVLEDKRFVRVGGTTQKEIDIRVVSSTNQDLESLMDKGLFREDLYYRLNAVQINIPPLRERPADVPLIADSLIKKFSIDGRKRLRISDQAMDILQSYSWPGNVRELKHVIEYCVLMSDDLIMHNHLPARIVAGSGDTFQRPSEIHPLKESTKAYQKRLIQQVIHSFGNNLEGKRKASQALGISLSSLYQKLHS